ncbi:hypothetical protein C7271_10715 [filamentous cyanobacterium CCP5]|nr:hypothetical protein C7271_10715 [filamentous cyanobacterium CCP5]
MPPTAPPLSETELTQRILEMAQTGVYRESILTTFAPHASKRRIRSAIAQAKQFGLYSIASLRDQELGTYYQAEPRRVELFKSAIATAPSADANLAERLVHSTQAIQTMLAIAGGGAIGLFGLGSLCLLEGSPYTGSVLWLMGAIAAAIWMTQKHLARRLLR